jgi:hypothetical protein
MKEDLKSWGRKLHNQKPPDLYSKAKTPHKTILTVSKFFSYVIIFFLVVYINDCSWYNFDLPRSPSNHTRAKN